MNDAEVLSDIRVTRVMRSVTCNVSRICHAVTRHKNLNKPTSTQLRGSDLLALVWIMPLNIPTDGRVAVCIPKYLLVRLGPLNIPDNGAKVLNGSSSV